MARNLHRCHSEGLRSVSARQAVHQALMVTSTVPLSRPNSSLPPALPCSVYVSYNIPLVADIHFAPTIAMRVADYFEKIRINPGNFGG